MKAVIDIIQQQEKFSVKGKKYTLTKVLLSDGMEVDTVQDIEIGDEVQVWFDDIWGKAKLKVVKREEE
jgi:hypothetical protein